jgi:hypothetical protein
MAFESEGKLHGASLWATLLSSYGKLGVQVPLDYGGATKLSAFGGLGVPSDTPAGSLSRSQKDRLFEYMSWSVGEPLNPATPKKATLAANGIRMSGWANGQVKVEASTAPLLSLGGVRSSDAMTVSSFARAIASEKQSYEEAAEALAKAKVRLASASCYRVSFVLPRTVQFQFELLDAPEWTEGLKDISELSQEVQDAIGRELRLVFGT